MEFMRDDILHADELLENITIKKILFKTKLPNPDYEFYHGFKINIAEKRTKNLHQD